jgi:hypothetical protein
MSRYETCVWCDERTGRAGRHDDSLYLEDGTGPLCEECYEPHVLEQKDARIAELEAALEKAEGEAQRLDAACLDQMTMKNEERNERVRLEDECKALRADLERAQGERDTTREGSDYWFVRGLQLQKQRDAALAKLGEAEKLLRDAQTHIAGSYPSERHTKREIQAFLAGGGGEGEDRERAWVRQYNAKCARLNAALAKLKEAEGLLWDWITPDIDMRILDRTTRTYLASLGEGGGGEIDAIAEENRRHAREVLHHQADPPDPRPSPGLSAEQVEFDRLRVGDVLDLNDGKRIKITELHDNGVLFDGLIGSITFGFFTVDQWNREALRARVVKRGEGGG